MYIKEVFYPLNNVFVFFFFFSSRRRHTRSLRDWSSDVCSSDLIQRSTRQSKASATASRSRMATAHPHPYPHQHTRGCLIDLEHPATTHLKCGSGIWDLGSRI